MSNEKNKQKQQQEEENSFNNDQENELIKLKEELKLEKERKLVAMADLQNYKNRVERERKEMGMILNATMLNNLFEIQEDLNRAMSDIKDTPVGLTMIQDKIHSIINQYGLEEIKVSEGDKFDASFMEAIGSVTVQEDEKVNKVIHAERNAFKMKDNGMLVRTARVIVGKK